MNRKKNFIVLFLFVSLAHIALAQERRGGVRLVHPIQLAEREKTEADLWVATMGHSCVAPAIRPFMAIAAETGHENHTQVFQFAGGSGGAPYNQWNRDDENAHIKPALATGRFDVLTFGHFKDGSEVEDYARWIDLALKHNPDTRIYIQDLWPWTTDLFDKHTGAITLEKYQAAMDAFGGDLAEKVEILNQRYGDRVRVIPVGPAMVEMVKRFEEERLPGVDALVVPPKDPENRVGLYRDTIHPTGLISWLEGYVWIAAIYGKNPVEMGGRAFYKENPDLDRILREVAWKMVTEHPLSGR